MKSKFDQWMADHHEELVSHLAELIAIDTVSPRENDAYPWLASHFETMGARVRELPRHAATLEHPAGNLNEHAALPGESRGSLRAEFDADAPDARRHTLFSAHVDVVPGGPKFGRTGVGDPDEEKITGRGTVDTKGNIVMLGAALRFLRDTGCPLARQVTIDLVPEEEIGGNGALSSALHGCDATDVVALEPTGLEVFHGHRGCVGFAVDFVGRASHMGGEGVSAIDGAVEFIRLLREHERKLLAEARGKEYFSGFDRPTQINVGIVSGGEWAGSVPERCTLQGFYGFIPGASSADALLALENLVGQLSDPWLRSHSSVRQAGIHNGSYLADPDSEVACALRAAASYAGAEPSRPRAWNVSCDARLYHDLLDVPTVVFGAGSLSDAHSSHESLRMAEWGLGIKALAEFLSPGSTLPALDPRHTGKHE